MVNNINYTSATAFNKLLANGMQIVQKPKTETEYYLCSIPFENKSTIVKIYVK